MAIRKRRYKKRKYEKTEVKARPRVGEERYKMLKPNLDPAIRRWIAIVVLFGLAILSILALTGGAGKFGGYFRDGLDLVFGWGNFIFPIVLIIAAYFLLAKEKRGLGATQWFGIFLLVMSFSGLLHLFLLDHGREIIEIGQGGGYIGYGVSYALNQVMGIWAALIVLLIIFLVSVLIIFESWLVRIKEREIEQGRFWRVRNWWAGLKHKWGRNKEEGEESGGEDTEETEDGRAELDDFDEDVEDMEDDGQENNPSTSSGQGKSRNQEIEGGGMDIRPKKRKKVRIDLPIDLLGKRTDKALSGDIEKNKLVIKKTLDDFGIPVEMADVKVGPTVTQYTLKPSEGVKLSRIITLQNDLALALAAHPIRIEAPIPGKSLVGIEIPNQTTATVVLRELLETKEFKKRENNLTIAVGKDVAGQPWLADLGKLPHLLIAGATGSGKSVCLNSIIVSLLYQNSSEELKFILVDPKRVELTTYNGIPHLLTPVLTDVPKVISALKWTVGEMERRFYVLSEAGKRDIKSYNETVQVKMPYIVFAIDELADLMTAASAEVEGLIIRLAQMSRAVGIHLILATQRPSVDIITGLIKANIPARIAFSVASLIDSRTILDMSGAEKLLGRGDMLYISAELSKPKRLQGAYLSDREIEEVIRYLRERSEPDYNQEIVETNVKTGNFGRTSGVDLGSDEELYEEAKEVVMQAGKASASLLQRRLRIGYARAARLLDLLEEDGMVGPADGAKPREVMIKNEEGEEEMEMQEENEEGEKEEEEADN